MTGLAGSGGIFASVKNLTATLVTMGRTRLELLGNEIAVEKQRFLSLFLLSQVLVLCLILGVILLVVLMALLFWDQRLLVIAGMAVFFLGLAGYLYLRVQRLLHPPEPVFANSLAELKEDLRQLKAASDEQKPG
ncbi:MAG: phage holin family protein [Thiobacillus sp.]|nr:phage holin family protein [Thiobacillus sp.]